MKKIMFSVAAVVMTVAMFAQDAPKMDAKKDTKKTEMKMKEHVCTSSCKGGKHMYANGEKGHTCTAACKK
jgi:hypothetical protein